MFQFLCVTAFSLGGLVTMLRDHVELGVRVQMARDIFICILGFCLVTAALFFLRKVSACSHPVNTYKVIIKARGIVILLKYVLGGCVGWRV